LRSGPNDIGINAMNIDTTAIDDAVLALLYLTLHDHNRAWKSFDWDALNRLYERGLIGDPVNKTKSVILTDEGLRESERLFKRHFVTAGSKTN
jgi:hypothetical protein